MITGFRVESDELIALHNNNGVLTKQNLGRVIGADGHSPYIGANNNWYYWDEFTKTFIDSGVQASGGSKIRIDYMGGNTFLRGSAQLNFNDLYTMHLTGSDFVFVIYNDRAYLCSFVNYPSGNALKEMRFESVINADNRTKVSSIYVISNDGVNIVNTTVSDINSENSSNKVSEITESNVNGNAYPSTLAVERYVTPLFNSITKINTDIGEVKRDGQDEERQVVLSITTGASWAETDGHIIERAGSSYARSVLNVQPNDEYKVTIRQHNSATTYKHYIFLTDDGGTILERYAPTPTVGGTYEYTIHVVNGTKLYIMAYTTASSASNNMQCTQVIHGSVIPVQTQIDRIDTTLQEYGEKLDELTGSYESVKVGRVLADNARAIVMSHNRNDRCINFLWTTDNHVNGLLKEGDVDARGNLELYADLCREGWLDAAVIGGDTYTAGGMRLSEAFAIIDDVKRTICTGVTPIYACKGNHDVNAKCRPVEEGVPDWGSKSYYVWDSTTKSYVSVTQSTWDGTSRLYIGTDVDPAECISRVQWATMWQTNVGNGCVFNPDDPYGGYFYKDFEPEHLRIVITNCFEGGAEGTSEGTGFRGYQTKFIGEKALNFSDKDNPSEWSVLFFGHIPYPTNGTSETKTAFWNILNAFKNGTRLDNIKIDDLPRISVDYTGQVGAKIVGFVHGHHHADMYELYNGINIIGTDAGFGKTELYGEGETSQIGTPDEFALDVFSINTKDSLLYETRIGRGVSRVYRYGAIAGLVE